MIKSLQEHAKLQNATNQALFTFKGPVQIQKSSTNSSNQGLRFATGNSNNTGDGIQSQFRHQQHRESRKMAMNYDINSAGENKPMSQSPMLNYGDLSNQGIGSHQPLYSKKVPGIHLGNQKTFTRRTTAPHALLFDHRIGKASMEHQPFAQKEVSKLNAAPGAKINQFEIFRHGAIEMNSSHMDQTVSNRSRHSMVAMTATQTRSRSGSNSSRSSTVPTVDPAATTLNDQVDEDTLRKQEKQQENGTIDFVKKGQGQMIDISSPQKNSQELEIDGGTEINKKAINNQQEEQIEGCNIEENKSFKEIKNELKAGKEKLKKRFDSQTHLMSFIMQKQRVLHDSNRQQPKENKQKFWNTQTKDLEPEWFMSMQQIVEANGFEFEEHQVTTEDGYILTVHRLYKKDNSNTDEKRKVVFMQHGQLDSSSLWIINDPEHAPAFKLASQGYDVWLGNNRGSTYSRGHVSLDAAKSKDYWDFTFAEMGVYDCPAQVDFVRNHTGQDKITFIGHSQGSTQLLYGMAKQASQDFWKDRLNLFVAFNPVIYFGSNTIPFLVWAQNWCAKLLKWSFLKFAIMPTFYVRGVSPAHIQYKTNRKYTLRRFVPFFGILSNFFDKYINPLSNFARLISTKKGHFPNGSALKSIMHFGQCMERNDFIEFDYGSRKNMKLYGQREPPVVDLANIKDMPIAMFVGRNDDMVPLKDNRKLQKKIEHLLIFYKEYRANHLSFQLGNDSRYFKQLTEVMNKYA